MAALQLQLRSNPSHFDFEKPMKNIRGTFIPQSATFRRKVEFDALRIKIYANVHSLAFISAISLFTCVQVFSLILILRIFH